MNLNQVTLPCSNLKRSIAFYKLLGLNLIVHSNDRYARFEMPDGDATLSIHYHEKIQNDLGAMIYFEIENLDGYCSFLQDNGVVFDEPPTDKPWLWREARLKDPDGNQLVLFYAGENRKNPPWRIE